MLRPTASQLGFTLIELMMTLALSALLTVIALPGFGSLLAKTRTQTTWQDLAATFNAARLAAVSRAMHVVICPSSDQASCSDGELWQQGWIAFVDANRDREADANEERLDVSQNAPQGTAIVGSSARARIVYQPDGSARGSNVTLTLCNRGARANDARTLVIGPSGRIRSGNANAENAARCLSAAG
ncbi:MAG: GspH/FimT family pseudopilin [Dokdonella sp.]|uniref:GspH/FimT family pseudopilin n=1 Tax=Dokdonella sp. TaxID=2291710 RepID=UPI0025BD665E|nr:GspH/FimT family pseudopilin [Dokdonella sp.]MBZ0222244.1 GspH/FimT family pseudopilin [Dokdonella sp.]